MSAAPTPAAVATPDGPPVESPHVEPQNAQAPVVDPAAPASGGTQWIHRAWILVPFVPQGFTGLVAEVEQGGQTDVLVHSGSDRVRRLRQRTTHHPDVDELGCSDVQTIEVAGIVFLSAVLRLEPEPDDVSGAQKSILTRRRELETHCREIAVELARRLVPGEPTMTWVNRTLVVDQFDDDNSVWLSPDPVPVATTGVSGERPQIMVSWGNNVVLEAAFDDLVAREVLRVGMVDAQCVWLDLEAIGASAEELVQKQLSDAGGVPLGTGRTEALLMSVARHNLLYDEVLIHASAARSAVARALLTSWGYEQLRDRVDQRVRDSDAIDQRRRMRRAARHESRVSKVLLMLSLLSGAQLVLSVVGLAYSGGVESYPGGSRWSLFYWARMVGTDVWLLLTIGLAMLGYWRLQSGSKD